MATSHTLERALDRSANEETARLYELYSPRLHAFCLSQLGSRQEAEDALQTTFLNVHASLIRGRRPRIEQAWLYTIAHNVCRAQRRESLRRAVAELPGAVEAYADDAAAPEANGLELPDLAAALLRIPEQQRRAIVLREWHGLSYREIGRSLGLGQSAVETLIFRARRSLAGALAGSYRRNKHRAGQVFDLGWLVAAAQSALTGGAAVRAAGAVAVVTATAVTSKPPEPPPERGALPPPAGAKAESNVGAPRATQAAGRSGSVTTVVLAAAPLERPKGAARPRESARPNALERVPAPEPVGSSQPGEPQPVAPAPVTPAPAPVPVAAVPQPVLAPQAASASVRSDSKSKRSKKEKGKKGRDDEKRNGGAEGEDNGREEGRAASPPPDPQVVTTQVPGASEGPTTNETNTSDTDGKDQQDEKKKDKQKDKGGGNDGKGKGKDKERDDGRGRDRDSDEDD